MAQSAILSESVVSIPHPHTVRASETIAEQSPLFETMPAEPSPSDEPSVPRMEGCAGAAVWGFGPGFG